MGMEDEGGDHTRMDLSPFEKDGLGYREGRSLDQILEGPGESTETLAQQTLEVPAPAPIQARRTVPPPPPAGAVDAVQAPGSTAERRVVPPAVPPVSKPPSGATQRTTVNEAAALKKRTGPHPGHAPNLPANATRDEIRAQATASARMAQGGTSASDGGMVRGIVAGAIVAAVAAAAAFFFL
jgi:hypothetical protein